jgi:hypothetical protein
MKDKYKFDPRDFLQEDDFEKAFHKRKLDPQDQQAVEKARNKAQRSQKREEKKDGKA